MLAEHPDIEKRLREEIFTKVGPTEAPKYDQMREMRYVKAFLNGAFFRKSVEHVCQLLYVEILRLYPPVYVPNSLVAGQS